MPKRLVGVLALCLLLVGSLAGPAVAAEVERHHYSYEEIRDQASEVSQGFLPEAHEPPSLFQWIIYPSIVVAILVALAVLFTYLVWMPRFAQERAEKERKARR
jgi:hypothetical protein